VTHFPTDPDENAASIINLAEVVFSCLEAVGATTVAEVGAFHGKSTEAVLGWTATRGGRVIAIDPMPEPALRALATERDDLELVERTSIEALPEIEADAVILDGDHNYYTLSEELRLIESRAGAAAMPLLVLHDIGWPLARRDGYYVPERIPPEHRQPLARDTFLLPDEPGTAAAGMPFACVAAQEGGPRNGILTAVEDFLADHDELTFANVPAFFGVGFIWPTSAPWAAEVAAVLEPWDGNPVLARLEANRIRQMTERYRITKLLDDSDERSQPRDDVLRSLADSRALSVSDRVRGLLGRSGSTREEIRRVLGD
jgi:hypothetical protein